MSAAKSYYDALLLLSGKPALADARKALITGIDVQDLKDVIDQALNSGIQKPNLEYVVSRLLDIVVAERAGEVVEVPQEDVGDDAQVQEELEGSASSAQHGKSGVYIDVISIPTSKQTQTEDPFLFHLLRSLPRLPHHARQPLQTVEIGVHRVNMTDRLRHEGGRGVCQILRMRG
jgi:hypothetical protein